MCAIRKYVLTLISLVSFCAVSFSQEGKKDVVETDLPGFWRGCFLVDNKNDDDGQLFHFRMKISKVGDGFVGTAALWAGMSESLAREGSNAIVAETLGKQEIWYGAQSARETFRITIEGNKLHFEGLVGQYLYGANGCSVYPLNNFEAANDGTGLYSGSRRHKGETAKESDTSGFYIWKEGAFSQPLPLTLEKKKIHTISCGSQNQWHYNVYIPQSYDHTQPAPVLINHSPGGNGQPLSVKMAEELGWLMVGLEESRNGPWKPGSENEMAALVDLRRRFNVDSSRIYFSGFSGGSGRAARSSLKYPDNCAGTINIGGGYGTYVPPLNVPTFFIVGSGNDCGKPGAIKCYLQEKERRFVYIAMHSGGHSLGPQSMQDQAIQWMDDVYNGKITRQKASAHSMEVTRNWRMQDGKKISGSLAGINEGKVSIDVTQGPAEVIDIDALCTEDIQLLLDLRLIAKRDADVPTSQYEEVCPRWGSWKNKFYSISKDSRVKYSGCYSIVIKGKSSNSSLTGSISQQLSAYEYRGQIIKFSAMVKVGAGGQGAWLWFYVEDEQGKSSVSEYKAVENVSNAWQMVSMERKVPENAKRMTLGIVSQGKSDTWVDGVTFEVVKSDFVPPVQNPIMSWPANLDFEF